MKYLIIIALSMVSAAHADVLDGIRIAPEKNVPKYERKLYPHWIDEDNDGQNQRQELLIARSKKPVKFTNRRKTTVKSGEWFDKYTGVTFKKSSDVDIDHVIALKEVHISGGYAWTREMRQQYANDPKVLYIVHDWTNQRPKSADDVKYYMPSYVPFQCTFLKKVIAVKRIYKLSMDREEAATMRRLMRACP